MISDFSSFIEFFAAVYVTMAVNFEFCKNFWTPTYYKEIDGLLKSYNAQTSTILLNRLKSEIKLNYSKVQKHAQRKGTIMLAYCVFLLVFIGFEADNNCLQHYIPLFAIQTIVVVVLFLSKYLLKSWGWVATWLVVQAGGGRA